MSDPARADDQTAEPAAQTLQKDEKKNSFLETIRFLLTVAILAVALRSFLFAPFNIPSESMLPRLLVGDYLFVSKWPYGYSRWSFPFGIVPIRSEEHTSELQSLMRISYAVFCLKKKNNYNQKNTLEIM